MAGRVPVLVGVADTSLTESVNLAEHAADAGPQAVVLPPPYYFPANQAELLGYVEHIAAELPLPVLLYNLPSHTKLRFEPGTVGRLIDVPNVIGLKDSSAEMVYVHTLRRLVEKRADWTLLIGPEELLAEAVLLGGNGAISAGPTSARDSTSSRTRPPGVATPPAAANCTRRGCTSTRRSTESAAVGRR